MRFSQRNYIDKVLKRFGVQNSKPGDTLLLKEINSTLVNTLRPIIKIKKMQKIPYSSVIRSLKVCMRPDIAFIIGMLSRYLSYSSMDYWKAVKLVIRYLQRTKEYMFTYRRSD